MLLKFLVIAKSPKTTITGTSLQYFKYLKQCRSLYSFKVSILLSISTLFFLYPAISQANTTNLKNTKVILSWKPQAQFAGFYVAKDKGIYKRYGLDVSFLERNTNTSPSKLLQNDQADFAIMWLSSAIKRRSEGLKLVNIAQLIQRSSLMLIMKKSSGIQKPKDLQNKKVSLWEGELRLQPEAFFRKLKLNVKIIPQSYTVNLFLNDGVDVASAMWYNEYHTIINAGVNPDELVTFFFSDYGLNFPEDGIYMLEDNFNKDRAKAVAFVNATIEGWLYAFEHQEEAVSLVLKYMHEAHLPENCAHQKWMLARIKELILVNGEISIGNLKKDDYENVSKELMNNGLIKEMLDFNNFYIPLERK
ncbi:MAG: ABC transporter substrate-binding protein [Candidatus Omnitrophica bacterium]|nr:ABC transporter substrate-binding protein [Candidatus Omnitrophota bacterium]MBU1996184.1 ABC transporter substrate-binding protein [Candidatus Omnitrophota bacterium]MBU4334205.1 ABC transporter substrate-binding protein [Candidatus Omnitrophota bacterium]